MAGSLFLFILQLGGGILVGLDFNWVSNWILIAKGNKLKST